MHLEWEELGENVKDEVRENDEVPLVLTGCGREFGFHSECDWMSWRVLSRRVTCFDFSKGSLAAGWKPDYRVVKMKQEAFVLSQGFSHVLHSVIPAGQKGAAIPQSLLSNLGLSA